MTKSLMRDYLGKDTGRYGKMLDVKEFITEKYPPAYIMTAYYDS